MQDDSGRILKYHSAGHEFEVGKKQEELERGKRMEIMPVQESAKF